MRCTVLIVAVVAATLADSTARAQRAPASAEKPNVVLIITDDVGYGDLGSYGAPDIKTPNIDRLAREGVRFTDFYANGAVCTPTRAGLITGRYQQRVNLEWALSTSPVDLQRGLPVTGRSLPQLLKNNGYATALIGKWHLGFATAVGPNAHGFDHFFGFLSGAVNYFSHTRGDGVADLYENTTAIKEPGYLTDFITRRSVEFIDGNASRPFFLEVAYNAAHWPFQSPHHLPDAFPTNRGTTGDLSLFQGPGDPTQPTRKDYAEMLERADEGVGQILAALERHGLTRNTLVIFTNDNGGEWLSRNAPLFHRKATLWEGGIRVPAILRWPGRVPGGRTTRQVGITMDLTATIVAATGSQRAEELRLEGVDLIPLLQGSSARARTLFWRINNPNRQQRAVRDGTWKLLIDSGQLFLFDLSKDIGERNDLAMSRSDLVTQLRRRIVDWETDVDAEAKARSRPATQ
jgi:arylsulfatase A-like enzyme